MPYTRKELTWIIGSEGSKLRTLCLEAHSPRVIEGFIRRCGGAIQTKTVEVGRDPSGNQMDVQQRHNLLQGLRRNEQRLRGEAATRFCQKETIISMVSRHHGLKVEVVMGPTRDQHISRARGHVAHELRSQCGLSQAEIAKTLGLRRASSIAYWLSKPYEEVSTPAPESPWISQPKSA